MDYAEKIRQIKKRLKETHLSVGDVIEFNNIIYEVLVVDDDSYQVIDVVNETIATLKDEDVIKFGKVLE